MKVLQTIFCGLLACTSVVAVVQYCADDISQGAQFCVSMASFRAATNSIDLYVTIELLDRPGTGWIAFGIGDRMADSLMFIILTDKTGASTVTTRTTSGHFPPEYDAALSPVGAMISSKPVRKGWRQISFTCVSCNEWSNFEPDSQSQPWTWARNSYVQIEHADERMSVQMHDSLGFFYANMTKANENASKAASAPQVTASKGSYGTSSSSLEMGAIYKQTPAQLAREFHGPLLGTAFMILFPAGAAVSYLKPNNWFWIHITLQALASSVCIIGVIVQVTVIGFHGMWHRMSDAHIIVGLLLAVLIIVQLFLGYWHHVKFIRSRKKSRATYLHVWNGRLVLATGGLNIGLGLGLAKRSNIILYAWSLLTMFEVIFISLVLPCIESRISKSKANVFIIEEQSESDESATHLLEPKDDDVEME